MTENWRSASALRIMLVAALATTAAVGGFNYVSAHSGTPMLGGDSASSSAQNNVASFTTADAGTCLTWELTDGAISSFEQTDCAGPHRFEVSSREDLAAYPTSEFGPSAPRPSLTRQAQLREELCKEPTMSYLGGTFDPSGKYSIAPILPPQENWDAGDRTLLCGVQATDENGTVITTTGKAAQQDQSRIFSVGDCVAIDSTDSKKAVPCSKPHQMETTLVVDLLSVFPDSTPSVEQQDTHLKKVCTKAAQDYLGGDDPLYYSTLQPYWDSIPEDSWSRGSHSVNCSLMFADGGKLGTLEGSAKGTFTINGNPPAERPERKPIVNPEALESVGATTTTATPAP